MGAHPSPAGGGAACAAHSAAESARPRPARRTRRTSRNAAGAARPRSSTPEHGEMVMQTEHIPLHLGPMPAAVEAVLDQDLRAGRLLGAQPTPTPSRHAPPSRHHRGHARVRRRRDAARLRRLAPTTPTSAAASRARCPPTRHARGGGRRDLAARPRRGRDRRARRADAPARPAARRPARAARRQPRRRNCAWASSRSASGRTSCARRPRPCSTTPSGARGRAWRSSRTASARPSTSSRRRGRPRAARHRDGQGRRVTLDFAGSADEYEATSTARSRSPAARACSRSASSPTRTSTDSGAYRPITVTAPGGSLLNARSPAAVAGGNVETPSRVADLVLRAFGRAVARGRRTSTLGTEDWTYYETIGGGQGACPDADGPSGVHVAMSNTLNTPVEALELEFPMRVTEYSVRRGSGGDGRHRGGDGVIREVEALEGHDVLAADRAPASPAAGRRRRWGRGVRPGTSSGITRSSRRPRERCRAGSGCASRPPAVAATGPAGDEA